MIYDRLHRPIINFFQFPTGKIIGSWFVSPVLSGGMSVALFMLINRFILKTKNPLKSGLWSLPIFYGVTLFVNLFSIIHDGPECK
jgi:sodium-dependent phosphate transporter